MEVAAIMRERLVDSKTPPGIYKSSKCRCWKRMQKSEWKEKGAEVKRWNRERPASSMRHLTPSGAKSIEEEPAKA